MQRFIHTSIRYTLQSGIAFFTVLIATNSALLPYSSVFAQTTDATLGVTCRPNNAQVRPNTPVTWRATVTGDADITGVLSYEWDGTNITSENAASVTTSYGSNGTKRATITVTKGGQVATAECTVSVRANPTTQNPGGGSGGNTGGSEPVPPLPEVPEDNPANRLGGEGQGGDQFSQQLQQIAQSILECSMQGMMGQGLQNIMGQMGQQLFGGAQNAIQQVAGQALGQIAGPLGGMLGGGGYPPSVPVDPVTTKQPINAIGAKEVGPQDANGVFQGPPLDGITYCLANSTIQYISEGAGQWLQTGYNGNPTFVENSARFSQGINDLHTQSYFQRNPNMDRGVARTIANDAQGQSNTPTDCGNNTSPGTKPEDLFKVVFKRSCEQLALSEFESDRNNATNHIAQDSSGDTQVLSKRDEEGSIQTPNQITTSDTAARVEAALKRQTEQDEHGNILSMLLEKIFSMIPGLIGQAINSALQ